MKKGKKALIVILSVMAVLIIGIIIIKFAVFTDNYYMSHINGINFPENVTVLNTRVSKSDIYGVHMLAEEVIETALSWEEVKEIVPASEKGENIHVLPVYVDQQGKAQVEYDDYSIELVRSIEGKAKNGMNYYLLSETTEYASMFWFMW